MGEELRQILERHDGRFVSGEEISRALGKTRAAVWKQVQGLRKRGYSIEGTRGEGYRLVGKPDLVEPGELSSRLPPETIFRAFEHFPVTDSTNSRATGLAEKGAPEGTVVTADEQTSGRGRMGRRWVSPPGLNLYVSLLLRPPIEPVRAPQMTMLTAVALAEGVEDACNVPVRLKWPNDLYLDDRKCAGILAEMSADPDRVRHVVIGVGLNVNGTENDFPEELRERATSLRILAGRTFRRIDVLAAFLARFERAYATFLSEGSLRSFLPAWERRSLLTGRRVLLRIRDEEVRGTAAGVDETGTLRFLRDGSREEESVCSGEILEFER